MAKSSSIRLDGKISLLSPLSHIGESHGPDSYLSESTIIGPEGKPVTCFTYSGNAFRGMLRDLGTEYLLEKIGNPMLPLDTFYMLFSGGAIGGDQSIDIDQGRRYRQLLPLFSILGGGVGNQILQGKMNIGAMFPMVKECQRVVPARYRQADAPSWRHWTEERSYTRTDDAKNENLRKHLQIDAPHNQETLLLAGDIEPKQEKKKDAPQQMRYTIEMLAAGSEMYQRIDLVDMSELELGAFVSALYKFSERPYIGGQNRIGCGLVEVEYEYHVDGEIKPFMTISEDRPRLSSLAANAKQSYDTFLQELYDKYLLANKTDLAQLIVGGAKSA